MNIFVVSYDPVTAAKELCDKHVVKMIAESAQMIAVRILMARHHIKEHTTIIHAPCGLEKQWAILIG